MKRQKMLVLVMMVAVMIFSFAACGGSDQATGDDESEAVVTQSTAPAEAETIQQAATEQIAEAVDTKTQATDLTGNWADINDSTRFVNITSDGTNYNYEDNEGKLPATFADGKLTIKVSDTDSATAYIDSATSHLMVVYGDNISEYAKK